MLKLSIYLETHLPKLSKYLIPILTMIGHLSYWVIYGANTVIAMAVTCLQYIKRLLSGHLIRLRRGSRELVKRKREQQVVEMLNSNYWLAMAA
jgi:hypothetical protein